MQLRRVFVILAALSAVWILSVACKHSTAERSFSTLSWQDEVCPPPPEFSRTNGSQQSRRRANSNWSRPSLSCPCTMKICLAYPLVRIVGNRGVDFWIARYPEMPSRRRRC
jgi:hypothetical protein